MSRRSNAFILPITLGLAIASLSGCQQRTESRQLKTEIARLSLDAQDPDLTLQLKEGIAVLADPPSVPDALAKAYRSAENPVLLSLGAGKKWVIVSAGPLLDSPDQAQVQKALFDGRVFHITIVHTSARLRGAGLRRNRPWRPLLLAMIEPPLPPGEYKVEVIWQALESIPAGKELSAPLVLAPLSFTVTE
jgi:hypothetical protein